ncbi:MAG: molybdenum ABC transporter ATP-binding protein [Burkholderiales bacterium]
MRLELDIAIALGTFELEAKLESDAGVTALFGRSGAGKTTILNAIAGLVRPQRGTLRLDGMTFFDAAQRIDLPVQRRRLGYVFQEGRLLPHLTVRQNLLYGRFFTPAGERRTEFDPVVALLDLAPLLARRPHDLSGGEKQRVAIGRALLASPRLLLMDEPLASLDAGRKGEILYYIERLRDETRIPIVYVSHAIDEVVRLADTVALVSEGRVRAIGPVAEMAGRLDLRPHLGRFEGGAVIEATVAEQDLDMGLARLVFPGGELYAPDVDALAGTPVRVRIRARDVALALSRPMDASFLNVLAGTVTAVGEDAGASVDVQLAVGGTPVIARITRKSCMALGLAPGKSVYALVKAVAIDRHSVGYA